MQTFTILMYMESTGEARNFCLGGGGASCSTNIFIKTTPQYTYTHAFLLYTLFYLISYIYIYTHTHTPNKK